MGAEDLDASRSADAERLPSWVRAAILGAVLAFLVTLGLLLRAEWAKGGEPGLDGGPDAQSSGGELP